MRDTFGWLLFRLIGNSSFGWLLFSCKKVEEAEGKEVLETIILKQEIEQLYRAYEACLKETEKIVLRSRYGLFGGKEQTQREIADGLGISRSYVSRIEKRALEKMRRGFAEHK